MSESLAATIEAAGGTTSRAVVFNFILNLLLRSSISTMLASVIGIQIIIHVCLTSVIVPPNA